jgi:hypothetical protein
VIDASGDVSVAAQQVTVARLAQAGVIPTTTYAAVIESHLAAAAHATN